MTLDQLQTFLKFPVPVSSATWFHRQLFSISFAFIGISFVDMAFLRNSDIENGRLQYRRRKTGKMYSIGVNDINRQVVCELLEVYPAHSHFLLPIIKKGFDSGEQEQVYSREVYHRCNKHLKKLLSLMRTESTSINILGALHLG